jgi:hypothetical protein
MVLLPLSCNTFGLVEYCFAVSSSPISVKISQFLNCIGPYSYGRHWGLTLLLASFPSLGIPKLYTCLPAPVLSLSIYHRVESCPKFGL